jgi:hypothetical protein
MYCREQKILVVNCLNLYIVDLFSFSLFTFSLLFPYILVSLVLYLLDLAFSFIESGCTLLSCVIGAFFDSRFVCSKTTIKPSLIMFYDN